MLLQVLLKATIALEHRVANYFKAKPGGFAKFMRYFTAWLILFGSKFVILEALVFAFGDDVYFGGPFHGVVVLIVVVIAMLVAEEAIVQLYRRLSDDPRNPRRSSQPCRRTKRCFESMLSRDLLETLIRFGLIVFLAVMCARVFAPFANLMIWGLILAVALEPLNAKLAARMGGRRGLAATVLTLVGLLLLGVPTVMLGNSFATHVQEVAAAAQAGTLHIPAPSPGVAEWPIVGKKVYAVWNCGSHQPAGVRQREPGTAEGPVPEGPGGGRQHGNRGPAVPRRADHRRDHDGLRGVRQPRDDGASSAG